MSSNLLSAAKGYLKSLSLTQDNEVESLSEEHNRPSLGHLRPTVGSSSGLCLGNRDGSLSSQDSRTESASLSQSQTNGGFGTHDRRQPDLQHYDDSQLALAKRNEKNGTSQAKAKRHAVVETPEYSDRGDSDTDEATYSNSQEQTGAKKAWFISTA